MVGAAATEGAIQSPPWGAKTQLVLVIVVLTLTISCWFAAGAALPSLTVAFDLTSRDQTMLVIVTQLGFALGAVAFGLSALPDRVRPEVLLPVACLVTAAVNLAPLAEPESFATLSLSRFVVGVSLAAVYPTGMRLALSWTGSTHRGLAVGAVVAALTLGTASPQLLLAFPLVHWQVVLAGASTAAFVGAAFSLALRNGPHGTTSSRINAREATALLRDPVQRRISISYLGHMWEVYGLWVWLPAFQLTITAFAGWDVAQSGLLMFALVGLSGALGCIVGGTVSITHGKRRVARVSVATSGACALMSPWLMNAPLGVAILVLLIWCASAIADSPLFSAMTGDEARGRPLGAALAVQMGLGYVVSAAAIGATAAVAHLVGWRWSMVILVIGPAVATACLAPRRATA